jgi:PAS domain-containing protein
MADDDVTIDPAAAAARIADLERENTKLRKINRSLMDRVERSMDAQGSAFSMFQTSVMLGQVVRDRTADLAEALSDLEASNRALTRARDEAETAKGRLSDAIESISQALVLFDAEDRLVLANSVYQSLWEPLGVDLSAGTPFGEIARLTVDRSLVDIPEPEREAWVARRIARHGDPRGAQVYPLADGRWMQVNERRTRDGGVVSVYTDITDLKQRETEQRERELAQKSRLLQSTLDNLSQGVAVFDGNLRLVAWNSRFFDLWDMPEDLAQVGAPLEAFLLVAASRGEYGASDAAQLAREQRAALLRTLPSCWERYLEDGRVLEMQHHLMPDGGFVCAYTDITGRTHAAEALRDSERRIRLITDAMPALIAFADMITSGMYMSPALNRSPTTLMPPMRPLSIISIGFTPSSTALCVSSPTLSISPFMTLFAICSKSAIFIFLHVSLHLRFLGFPFFRFFDNCVYFLDNIIGKCRCLIFLDNLLGLFLDPVTHAGPSGHALPFAVAHAVNECRKPEFLLKVLKGMLRGNELPGRSYTFDIVQGKIFVVYLETPGNPSDKTDNFIIHDQLPGRSGASEFGVSDIVYEVRSGL